MCLFDNKNKTWNLVYQTQYLLDNNRMQKDEFYGSWGPIIETFEDNYSKLNPIGFYNTRLYNDANNPLLENSNSQIRDDFDGIDVIYLEQNHTFIAG